MKDLISINRIKLLHPKVRNLFTLFINEIELKFNLTVRIVQGLRTIEEQNALYEQGRTKPGKIVTNAKGGSSYHNYGLAIDIVPMNNGIPDWGFDYSKLKDIARKYGLTWGGSFKSIVDKPHFEITFGNNWRTLLDKYNKKDFIPNTTYVNI